MSPENKTRLDIVWLGLAVGIVRALFQAQPEAGSSLLLGMLVPSVAALTFGLSLFLALPTWWGRLMPALCLGAALPVAVVADAPVLNLLIAAAAGGVVGLLCGLLWTRFPRTVCLAPLFILAGVFVPAGLLQTVSYSLAESVGLLFMLTTWLITISVVIPMGALAQAVRFAIYPAWAGYAWYAMLTYHSLGGTSTLGLIDWGIALLTTVFVVGVALSLEGFLWQGLSSRIPAWQAGAWLQRMARKDGQWPQKWLDQLQVFLGSLPEKQRISYLVRLVESGTNASSLPIGHRDWLTSQLSELASKLRDNELRHLTGQLALLDLETAFQVLARLARDRQTPTPHRTEAMSLLMSMDPSRGLKVLSALLTADRGTTWQAALTLMIQHAAWGPDLAFEALAAAVKSERLSVTERVKALNSLPSIDPVRALKVVAEALADRRREVVKAALTLMIQHAAWGPDLAFEALAAAVKSEHLPAAERIEALNSLPNIDPVRTLAVVADMLDDREQEMVKTALKLLPRLESPEAHRILTAWLAERSKRHWSGIEAQVAQLIRETSVSDSIVAEKMANRALADLPKSLPTDELRHARLAAWIGHLGRPAPIGKKAAMRSGWNRNTGDRWRKQFVDTLKERYATGGVWQQARKVHRKLDPRIVTRLIDQARTLHEKGKTLAAQELLSMTEQAFPDHPRTRQIPVLRVQMEADYLEARGWLRIVNLEPGEGKPWGDPRRLRLVNQGASYPITVLRLGLNAERINIAVGGAVVVPLHPDHNRFVIYSDTVQTTPVALTWRVVPGLAQQAKVESE